MNNKLFKTVLALAGVATITVGCGGSRMAKDVVPSEKRYSFVAESPTISMYENQLYARRGTNKKEIFLAYITSPADYSICFGERGKAMTLPVKNAKGQEEGLKFVSGIYPFQIFDSQMSESGSSMLSSVPYVGSMFSSGGSKKVVNCDKLSNPKYTGAIAFYNFDSNIEFATFGLSDETKLFSPAVMQKAGEGVLGTHTIAFDGKPRISYWIGNRTSSLEGGESTVELDFSGLNLAELKINDKKLKEKTIALPAYNLINNKRAGNQKQSLEHRIYMKTESGQEFEGYIRDLKDNEFTAFMKIPCKIPAELFDAAAKGTVAKFDVMSNASEGGEGEKIAQILFGLKR